MKHFFVGGSSYERIRLCPGSAQLVSKLPRTSSAAAERGTRLHTEVGRMIQKGTFNSYGLTGPDITAVHIAHNEYRRIVRHGMTAKLEVRVIYNEHAGGTADVLGWNGRTGVVADFKFGSGRVDAHDNPQLQFYAAAALECGALPEDLTHVRLAIIQPAARPVMTQHKVSVGKLTKFSRRVYEVTDIAAGRDAPLVPGAVQCEWCPAKPTCPALKNPPKDLGSALGRLTSLTGRA